VLTPRILAIVAKKKALKNLVFENLNYSSLYKKKASKTQEFNQKMNVVQINLEANMGMNVSIFLHYG
jgi:hypothetical protein